MTTAGLDETEAWYFMRLAAQRRGQVLNWTWVLVAIAVAVVMTAANLDRGPSDKPSAATAQQANLKQALRDRPLVPSGRQAP